MNNLTQDLSKLSLTKKPEDNSITPNTNSYSNRTSISYKPKIGTENGWESNTNQNSNRRKFRDPTWLQVEVCREFLRGECSRSHEECRYGHPKPHCLIENGKVTTCFDSLKSRCMRERCKFFHPPKHIKTQIQHLGKSYQQYTIRNTYAESTESYENQQYSMMNQYQYYWYNPWDMFMGNDMYSYQNQSPTYAYYPYLDVYQTQNYYNVEYQGEPYYQSDYSTLNDRSEETYAVITDE